MALSSISDNEREIEQNEEALFMASPKHHDEINYPSVRVTKTVSVLPKSLCPQQILHLSNLDRQCPMLMYLVFFYKSNCAYRSLSLDSIFSSLKSGLEETLSIWYPAAGRLTLNPDDINGKLNLWCNNNGAVLVEAITDTKIIELGDLSQYNKFFEYLVHKPVFHGNFSEMPLVVAQVTRFGCGGYSIGFGTSHSLFDGPAAYDFLHAWASNSAILKEKRGIELYKPVHERGTLLEGNQGQNKVSDQSGSSLTSAAAIDHLYQLIKQAIAGQKFGPDMTVGSGNLPHEVGISNLVLKTFHLSGAMIDSIKSKVFGERKASFSCSTFELLAAHLWKAKTKALGLRKGGMVCLQFAVDVRNKMVPPLPKGFSGNAYVLASVAITGQELEEGSHEAIVEKIKEAKNSIGNDYVHAYNKALNGPQSTLPPMNELTFVSDWTRMPFHKIDFLHGEAAYASPLATPIPQVAYFMQDPGDLRGIDIRIGLLPQTLDAFAHYFLINLR